MPKRQRTGRNSYVSCEDSYEEFEEVRMVHAETQTENKKKTLFESREKQKAVYKLERDVSTYKVRVSKPITEWKKDNSWTPFLFNFKKEELYKMGYDTNVYYSMNVLKEEIELLKNQCLKCPICFSYRKQPIVWTCGHWCCETCNTKVDNCPICREQITTDIAVYI